MTHQPVTLRDLAKMIDHSLLHPTMTDAEIRAGCELARRYEVATACVKPYAIELAREVLDGSDVLRCSFCASTFPLDGSDVLVCPVIGFPHGNSTVGIKVAEAENAARAGGREIDMVVNVGKVLGGDWDYVSREIRLVNEVVLQSRSILKVIFENDYLREEHIIRLCEICSAHGVAFVKTSTGYGFVKQPDGSYNYRGATVPHLRLMRAHSQPGVQLKAAGGVRTLDDLLLMRALGVRRVGATATAAMLDEAAKRGEQNLRLPDAGAVEGLSGGAY